MTITLSLALTIPTVTVGVPTSPNAFPIAITQSPTFKFSDFEVEMGTFKNSINPNTKSFTEFKSYLKNNLNKAKDKKIVFLAGT